MRVWFFCPTENPLVCSDNKMYMPFSAVQENMPPICLNFSKKVTLDGVLREVVPIRGFLTYGTNDQWLPIGIQSLVAGLKDFTSGKNPEKFYIVEAEMPEDEIIVLDRFEIGKGIEYFERSALKQMYFKKYQTGLHAYVSHIVMNDVVGMYHIKEVKEGIYRVINVYPEPGALPLLDGEIYTDGVGNLYSPADEFKDNHPELIQEVLFKMGMDAAYSYMSINQVYYSCNKRVADRLNDMIYENGVEFEQYAAVPLIDIFKEDCVDVCVDVIAEEIQVSPEDKTVAT